MASNLSNSTNSFRELEEGEIIETSMESNLDFNSSDFKNSTNFFTNKSCDQSSSLINLERSLMDIFTMDCSEENKTHKSDNNYQMNKINNQFIDELKSRSSIFTGWTDQLVKEQREQKKPIRSEKKAARQRLVTEDLRNLLRKKELMKTSTNIAESLKERRKDIVYKIVEACGIHLSSELCTEAIMIHSTIGMLTPNGKPRTLGGCFFQLVKSKGNLSDDQKKRIFSEPTSQLPRKKKQARNVKKKLKKQLKVQNQLENLFAEMNLDISVRLK